MGKKDDVKPFFVPAIFSTQIILPPLWPQKPKEYPEMKLSDLSSVMTHI